MTRHFFVLTIFICFSSLKISGQSDRNLIISSFDKVEFNPDSTIKSAYKIKKGLYHGYSIEFDSLGQVKAIGKYKKGQRVGTWRFNYFTSTFYKKGQHGFISVTNYDNLPEREQAKQDFEKLYRKLITSN